MLNVTRSSDDYWSSLNGCIFSKKVHLLVKHFFLFHFHYNHKMLNNTFWKKKSIRHEWDSNWQLVTCSNILLLSFMFVYALLYLPSLTYFLLEDVSNPAMHSLISHKLLSTSFQMWRKVSILKAAFMHLILNVAHFFVFKQWCEVNFFFANYSLSVHFIMKHGTGCDIVFDYSSNCSKYVQLFCRCQKQSCMFTHYTDILHLPPSKNKHNILSISKCC